MKTDRRTKYTKMVIRDAFLSLVKTKPIQKITIADICGLADISRPTFYLHYRDIYALLDEIGENMLTCANLNEITKFSLGNQDKIHKIILNLIGIIEKNIDIYRICILERGVATRFPKQIADELNNTLILKWENKGLLDQKLDKSYLIDFIQSSFNSIIYCWINRKENRETPEELAHIIETFLIHGLSGFVGKNTSLSV